MINSLDLNQSKQHQSLQSSSNNSNSDNPNGSFDGEYQDIEMDGSGSQFQSEFESHKVIGQDGQSHSKTVQALRKYLQRKLSSEDSSSERESPQEKDVFHRSFDTAGESKSTLTCSIVYPATGKSNFPLQKQRSLDDYTIGPNNSRYLRTDLCVPILLSRCTFCDQSFELEESLRAHMRVAHWNYFFDKNSQEDDDSCSSTEVLDLSMRKLTDTSLTHSLPNLESLSVASSASSIGEQTSKTSLSTKKAVVCVTCGKGFSTKWNWKQHQKIHLRENLQAYLQ